MDIEFKKTITIELSSKFILSNIIKDLYSEARNYGTSMGIIKDGDELYYLLFDYESSANGKNYVSSYLQLKDNDYYRCYRTIDEIYNICKHDSLFINL